MHNALDEPRPVRAGEELDLRRLEAFLRAPLDLGPEPLSVEQFPHGHSNLTYLLRSGAREWVLRRPPFGNQVKSAHDMGREFRVLSHLSPVHAPAPRPLLVCADESVVGAPFYIMERRRGVILRRQSTLDPPVLRGVCEALIDGMVQLHALDYQAAGLGDLGKPEGYVARQIGGWTKRYEAARTEDVPALEQVAQWLANHQPTDSPAALIHNDYKFDNLVLDPNDPTRIVAVLDWEMATIGDPLMDLGSTLGYWVQADDPPAFHTVAMGPTHQPGSLTRHELVDRYAERSGRSIASPLFFYCYGLFKLAVIVQQIYARYVRGLTRDERFAQMNQLVHALGAQGVRALETEKI